MRKRLLSPAVALALLAALAACGGSEYRQPQELTRALREKGVDCAGLQVKSGRHALRSFAEDASCAIEGEPVLIWTFEDSDAREEWFEFASDAFQVPYVLGSTWVIASRSGTALERVQEAIGGEVKRPGEQE